MAMLPSGEALQHHFDQLHDDPATYPTDTQVSSITSLVCETCSARVGWGGDGDVGQGWGCGAGAVECGGVG